MKLGPEEKRKRRTWIAGSLMGTILLCWYSVTGAEHKPFKFMRGAEQLLQQLDSRGVCTSTYAVTSPINEFALAADAELKSLGWGTGSYNRGTMIWQRTSPPMSVTIYTESSGDVVLPNEPEPRVPEVPLTTRGFLQITHEPSLLDKVRAWTYSLRYDAAPDSVSSP